MKEKKKEIKSIFNLLNIGMSIMIIGHALFYISLFTGWEEPLVFLGYIIAGGGLAFGGLIV